MYTIQFMVPSERSSTLHAVIELEVVQWVSTFLSEFLTVTILRDQMSISDHNFVKWHII